MQTIQLSQKTFIPFISEAEILSRIDAMAKTISKDYATQTPLFVAILNGSFMFAADLFKHLTMDAEIAFTKIASYRGTKSSGEVLTLIGLDANITNRHIVIVEDIVDTGKTMHQLLPTLHQQNPASVAIACLLHKPTAIQYPIPIQYSCFSIPDKFVIGYGLDLDGLGRNYKDIYQLKPDV